MQLKPGEKLGPYEIVSRIGKGGMGEVWHARDPRLNRDVAIKISAQQFTDRFEREARAIAALNHPNICTLYDVGPNYLVMELVEGPTLADRIARGPIPLEEALGIAKQIADALEAAHEKNIVHRDLKPANIKIRPDDSVKVLDFGLAKAGEAVELTSDSPTMLSVPGMILGTAAYMAPEQAAAQNVDKRADIWAFAVVLYEMLTGQRLFQGDSVAHLLADVLRGPIEFDKLPQETPRAIRDLMKRCLDRDVKTRLRDIGEARIAIRKVLANPVDALDVTQPAPARSRFGWVVWGVAALLLLAIMALGLVHFRETPPEQQSYRFQIAPPPNTRFSTFRLSPDGRYVAFIATSFGLGVNAKGTLWIRALDSLESRQITGSEGSFYPFWSPDSAFVGFFQGGKLKKVSATGGPAQTICDVVDSRGGSWGDGNIIFADGPSGPLFRVPSSGGKPAQITKFSGSTPGEGHRFPEFLPDGRHFLFLLEGNKPEATGIHIGSLDGGAPVRLLPDDSNAVYIPNAGAAGYLLFLREGTLLALPFNAAGLKATAEAFPVAENVAIAAHVLYGAFSARNGTLAYWNGGLFDHRELVWMDRSGKRLGVIGKPNDLGGDIALSPDEKTVAVTVGTSAKSDIWLMDSASGASTRFTFGPTVMMSPIWSADGRSIVYSRRRGQANDILRRQITGGTEELLLQNIVNALPSDFSSDGKFVVHRMSVAKTGSDIGLLAADGDHRESVYLGTPANEGNARFSPDGRWMAYQSDESGQFQVYVQTIPVGGGKFQISTAGGTLPAWRRDGKELYYLAPDQKLMAVPVKIDGASFEPGTPQALFTAPPATGFAVTRDGQRFLMNLPAGGESAAAGPPLTIVTNWQAGLKK